MKPQEVVDLRLELAGLASTREEKYDKLESAYGGLFADRQRDGAFKSETEGGRPDRISSERDTPDIIIPIARSIAESTRTYIGQLPSLRVPPPDDTEAAMNLAEKQERCSYGMWNWWNLARRMSDVGLYASVLGTAVGCMWPDIEKSRPKLTIRSPRGCYVIPRDEDGYELSVAIFSAKYNGRQAAKLTGKKEFASKDEVVIDQYIDEREITTVADGQLVKRITHRLGFCPVVCIQNIPIPGSPWGESTIANVVDLQKEWSYAYSLLVAMMEEQFTQPIILEGAENWPDGLPNGTRDVVELQAGVGAKAYRLPPPQLPFDSFRITDMLEKLMTLVSDVPQALIGGQNNPYESGSGFAAKLAPVEAKLKSRTDTIYPAVKRLMWMAWKMIEVMWPDQEYTVYGTLPLTSRNPTPNYVETFNVKEFAGWYECEIFASPSTYMDEQTRFVEAIQAVQNQMLSKETAMQFNPFIKAGTLNQEKQRINREVTENVQQNLAAQQAAQTMTNPPMGQPGYQNYMMSQGYSAGETAPIPGGLDVSQNANVPESGNNVEAGNIDPLIAQAADLIRSMQGITGRLFIVGSYLDPNYRADTSGAGSAPKITLDYTDGQDKAKVLQQLQKGPVPELYGNITWGEKVSDVPDEPFVEVTPGSIGYSVEGAETQPAEGEVAPGEAEAIAQALGGA